MTYFWEEIRRSFDALGVNEDGKVAVTEVLKGTIYPGFNPASKEATDMIRELDPKGRYSLTSWASNNPIGPTCLELCLITMRN